MLSSQTYIPLEDMNFLWKWEEVRKVIKLYKYGVEITEIKKIMKRPTDEVAVLIMDLGRKGLL